MVRRLPSPRDMAFREFTDRRGVIWRVWSTIPARASVLGGPWASGWLTFESETERRRLAPITEGWELLPPDRLELLCHMATRVSTRTKSGAWPVDDIDNAGDLPERGGPEETS